MKSTQYNKQVHHPLQSWQWAEARKAMGIPVEHIDEILMTIHPLPYIPYSIGYIPRSSLPTNEQINKLITLGTKHNCIFIKLEPNVQYTTETRSKLIDIAYNYNFKTSPHPLFPSWTQVLDLTPSENDLMKNLKPKTRYNIRYAQKHGVTVKEMSNDEGFEIFSRLYFETCKRQQYHGHSLDYHRIVWDKLKHDIARILICFYKEEPLGAYELFYFDKKLYYPYGGSSEKHRKLMANNLLMWEAIRLGKQLGAIEFDMWGSMPPDYDKSAPWAGFTRFKEGYGTKFKQFLGSYDLVLKPIEYAIYNQVYKVRERLLGH